MSTTMAMSYSHGREFVEQIRPLLERGDVGALSRHLGRYWPADNLKALLDCGHEEAACAALACLAFTGVMQDCPAIAPLLHDDDGLTADLAEHALWSIWFRAGGSRADERLARAVRLIGQGQLDVASDLIVDVLTDRPDYAEAYHQLSLVFFLRGDYQQTIINCRATLLLNPWHFGAMSVLGHAHAASGCLDQAAAAYQQALKLHPRMQGVRQAIRQIRAASMAAHVKQPT